MNNRVLYENYHDSRKLQKRILNRKNFTYKNIIEVLDTYTKNANKILDIGCGTGAIDLYLARKNKLVIGLDISRNAIETAILNTRKFRLEKNAKFFVSVFPKNAIRGKFDLIICSEVLEHISDDKKAVVKIFDLLKEKGIVIFTVPSNNSFLYKLRLAKKHDRKVGHLRRYTTQSLNKLLMREGFKIIESRKKEGILRNCLFVFPLGSILIRIANKFAWVSEFLTLIDEVFLKFFGEAQIIVVARK